MSAAQAFNAGARRGVRMAVNPKKTYERETTLQARRSNTVTRAWTMTGKSLSAAMESERKRTSR